MASPHGLSKTIREQLGPQAIRAAAKCEACGEGILAKTYAFSHDVAATIDKAMAAVRRQPICALTVGTYTLHGLSQVQLEVSLLMHILRGLHVLTRCLNCVRNTALKPGNHRLIVRSLERLQRLILTQPFKT